METMWHQNEFRIPTLLGVALIGGLVAAITLFGDSARILFSRAAKPATTIPQNVHITSISDSAALVYWKSEDVVASHIEYSGSQGSLSLYDIRDSDNTPKPYKLHVFSLTNLPPQQTTSFQIYIASQPVYKGTVTTGPVLIKHPQVLPLYGNIPKEIPDPEKGTVVTIIVNNSVAWTVFSHSSSWVMPLASTRDTDLANFYCIDNRCDDTTEVSFEFTSETVTVIKKATIGSSRPFSDEQAAVLGESTAVSPTLSVLSSTLTPTRELTPTSVPLTTKTIVLTRTPTPVKKITPTPLHEDVTIINPKEGASLSFSKPLIRGTGVPGKEVVITLKGPITQIGKTTTNKKGIWQWTPVYPLTADRYELSIVTNSKRVTRMFTILKSGERVLSASTPSATLIPTSPIIPTETPLVSEPSPTPTLYVTAGPQLSFFFIGGGAMLLFLALVLVYGF